MPTTTISDVRTISVNVSDQDDALRLLRRHARLREAVRRADHGHDALDHRRCTWRGDVDRAARRRNPRTAGTDTGIRFVVPDAAAEHASMHDRGIRVGELLLWDGVPPMFTFDDPDGNRFYVVEESW